MAICGEFSHTKAWFSIDMSILQRVFHFNSLYSSIPSTLLLEQFGHVLESSLHLCARSICRATRSSIALHKFATQVVLGHQASFDHAPSNLAKKIITPNSSLRKQPSLLKYYTKIRLLIEQAPTTETPQFHADYHKRNTIHHYWGLNNYIGIINTTFYNIF